MGGLRGCGGAWLAKRVTPRSGTRTPRTGMRWAVGSMGAALMPSGTGHSEAHEVINICEQQESQCLPAPLGGAGS